jgi:chromosomal replication initiation ATPase DnaA
MTVSPYINLILIDRTKQQAIIKIAEQYFDCSWREMTENRKEPHRTRRCMVYAIMRRYGISLTECGKLAGNRTHATVINALERHEDLLTTDEEYAKDYALIVQTFQREMPKHVQI